MQGDCDGLLTGSEERNVQSSHNPHPQHTQPRTKLLFHLWGCRPICKLQASWLWQSILRALQ